MKQEGVLNVPLLGYLGKSFRMVVYGAKQRE